MKWPPTISDQARDECYEYFDRNIRELKKNPNGKVDPAADGLQNNDVDAFRHAYVSGVMVQEFSESTAEILGRLVVLATRTTICDISYLRDYYENYLVYNMI
ncbi:MAG: hypothetical protein H6622_08475 [Halobacteriovoraceae bacterium]|nr:hypothetical protein [Halobacteriovoraceae bacterium]